MKLGIHKTQERLLNILAENVNDPLTIRELKEVLNLSSTNLVYHHISQLENKGYLKRNPNNKADYQVLQNPEIPISFVNLYGLAKCGPNGNILDGKPIDRIPLPSRLLKFPIEEAFLVRAEGDSMEPNILENDLILAQKKSKGVSGELIICTLNECTIFKKLRILESKDIMLESLNPIYEPIIISNMDEISIQGTYKGLIRI